MKKPLVLCILDGCGIREESYGNAFKNAYKPTFDYLWKTYPHSLLEASGTSVGLPLDQMGNSEVGHMNIGAGRIVYQPPEIINKALINKELYNNERFLDIINHVKNNNSKLHIMGLLSDGGVHSHIDHLFGIIDILKELKLYNVIFHVFTDGRDTGVKTSYKYIKQLEDKINEVGFGKIATISGRYYAMDRDNNYDRLKKAYDAICYGIGKRYASAKEAIEENYSNGVTDEFIEPCVLSDDVISDGDGILTFNYRPDRLREFFTALTNPNLVSMDTKKLRNINILTMFPVTKEVNCSHVFENEILNNSLGEVLHKNNLTQLRIAETEKYAHVTYFFDGGVEKGFNDMQKIIIPSPKVKTYDLKPEMSAYEITDRLLTELDKDIYDVVILNYANGDMVGHTGNYEAAIKAVEHLDKCLSRLYSKILSKDGILIITADHGNCDVMWDDNHDIVTTHTTNKVPFIITKKDIELTDGKLSDIAPTIIDLLNIKKPEEMTSDSLMKNIKND